MKKLFTLLVLIGLGSLLVACQPTKESSLKQLQALYTEVSENSDNYSVEDWDHFLDTYNQLDDQLKTFQYTDAEQQQISEFKGRCLKYVAKGKTQVAGKALKDAADEVGDELKGLMDELKK